MKMGTIASLWRYDATVRWARARADGHRGEGMRPVLKSVLARCHDSCPNLGRALIAGFDARPMIHDADFDVGPSTSGASAQASARAALAIATSSQPDQFAERADPPASGILDMDVIEPPPSPSSLRGLDAVNLFLAGALSGFGPYVAVFLAEQKWTEQNIGFVLTAGGFAGLLSRLPRRELLDAIRSKQLVVALGAIMVAASALIIAIRPSFPLVLAALVLQAITGGFLGLAVAAISVGLVGHAALAAARTQPALRLDGRGIAAGLMGVIGYILSYRAIFFAARAGPAAACRSRPHPAFRNYCRVSGAPGYQELNTKARRWSLWKNGNLLTFAGCECLFQLGNASMLPLAGEALVFSKEAFSSLIVSALIIVPQLIVALIASWAGRRANTWGAGLFFSLDSRHCQSALWCSPGQPVRWFSSLLRSSTG